MLCSQGDALLIALNYRAVIAIPPLRTFPATLVMVDGEDVMLVSSPPRQNENVTHSVQSGAHKGCTGKPIKKVVVLVLVAHSLALNSH